METALDAKLRDIKDSIVKASKTAHDAINNLQNGAGTRLEAKQAIDDYLSIMDRYCDLHEAIAAPVPKETYAVSTEAE